MKRRDAEYMRQLHNAAASHAIFVAECGPDVLRGLVRNSIMEHITQPEIDAVKAEEKLDRAKLAEIAEEW
jgi:hypothetical protein